MDGRIPESERSPAPRQRERRSTLASSAARQSSARPDSVLDRLVGDGYLAGFQEGFRRGFQQGFPEGAADGRRRVLLELAARVLDAAEVEQLDDDALYAALVERLSARPGGLVVVGADGRPEGRAR